MIAKYTIFPSPLKTIHVDKILQDFVKALFADPLINTTQRLGAVNSINWARILAQITYYFASYFTFDPSTEHIHMVVPTGNFGVSSFPCSFFPFRGFTTALKPVSEAAKAFQG